MNYHFKIHKEKGGYWAECLELHGCWTQGENREHLALMMADVVSAYLDEPESSTHMFPMPNPALKGRNIVEVPVDPKIAMAMMVRQSRLERSLTQRQVADKLGMKHISQYQKLESGKTANPELLTLVKLKGLYPDLSVDAVLA
ncbi:MAG TPA: helix-turn-helix domain-containing protein [Fibrobacteria bacterium]|nr:helix-turn-helix domain-containing protein [Fibrobacteria bacterium]